MADGPVDYAEAVAAMEHHVAEMLAGRASERVWLVEHPPIYTAGTSARDQDLRTPRFPVHRTGRGGQFTYHGPGQRVAYTMLDLNRRRPDVRAFVAALETLDHRHAGAPQHPGRATRRPGGRVGRRPDKPAGFDGTTAEDKVAAIGIRLKRWVSYHGIAINVDPDLGHFDGIVPCGISSSHYGVTSLVDLGHVIGMAEVDMLLRQEFERIFGPTSRLRR